MSHKQIYGFAQFVAVSVTGLILILAVGTLVASLLALERPNARVVGSVGRASDNGSGKLASFRVGACLSDGKVEVFVWHCVWGESSKQQSGWYFGSQAIGPKHWILAWNKNPIDHGKQWNGFGFGHNGVHDDSYLYLFTPAGIVVIFNSVFVLSLLYIYGFIRRRILRIITGNRGFPIVQRVAIRKKAPTPAGPP